MKRIRVVICLALPRATTDFVIAAKTILSHQGFTAATSVNAFHTTDCVANLAEELFQLFILPNVLLAMSALKVRMQRRSSLRISQVIPLFFGHDACIVQRLNHEGPIRRPHSQARHHADLAGETFVVTIRPDHK